MGVEPTHDRARRPCNSFEDCGAHRDPYTSRHEQSVLLLCHAMPYRVNIAYALRSHVACLLSHQAAHDLDDDMAPTYTLEC
jgi:hypothetical protein